MTKSHVRIFHAVPNAPAVDVYVNSNIVAEGLAYSKFTPYLPIDAGSYKVTVYPTGTTDKALIDTTLDVSLDTIYTVAAVGLPSNPKLFPIVDPKPTLKPGMMGIRFIHLSPDAPAVTVRGNGQTYFDALSYEDVTQYYMQTPGTYTFEVYPVADPKKAVLIVPHIHFKGYRYYSFYIIGLVNMPPMIEAVIPLDGSSYL